MCSYCINPNCSANPCMYDKKEFKVGDVWKTKGGDKALILDLTGSPAHPITTKVTATKNGSICISLLNKDGTYCGDPSANRSLKEPWKEPVKREYWVNMYKIPLWNNLLNEATVTGATKTRDQAVAAINQDRRQHYMYTHHIIDIDGVITVEKVYL